jgi:hypothetical protein
VLLTTTDTASGSATVGDGSADEFAEGSGGGLEAAVGFAVAVAAACSTPVGSTRSASPAAVPPISRRHPTIPPTIQVLRVGLDDRDLEADRPRETVGSSDGRWISSVTWSPGFFALSANADVLIRS